MTLIYCVNAVRVRGGLNDHDHDEVMTVEVMDGDKDGILRAIEECLNQGTYVTIYTRWVKDGEEVVLSQWKKANELNRGEDGPKKTRFEQVISS